MWVFFFCLFLGCGNFVFEIVIVIYDKMNFVYMVGRYWFCFVWEIYYVGDLRYEWYIYNVEKKIMR